MIALVYLFEYYSMSSYNWNFLTLVYKTLAIARVLLRRKEPEAALNALKRVIIKIDWNPNSRMANKLPSSSQFSLKFILSCLSKLPGKEFCF